MAKVTAKEETLSEMLGVSTRRIREVCQEAKISPGKYDLKLAVKLYVDILRGEGKKEIAELRKADKELKEYKLSIMKKETVPAEQIRLAVSDMQHRTKSKAMSIPVKASLELLGKDNRKEVELILKKYIHEFLGEMSNVNLEVENYDLGQ